MAGLVIIVIIIGVVLLALGLFIEAVKFLLWLGAAILIIGIIVALLRYIRGRR